MTNEPPPLGSAPPPVSQAASPPVKKKSGCLKWILGGGLLGILLFVGLFAVAAFLGGKDKDKMTAEIREFLRIAQSQGPEAAYGRTAESYRSRVSVEEMTANFGEGGPSAYLDRDWDWGRGDEAGRSTLVSETPSDAPALPPVRFSLEESEGAWRIADIGKPIEKPAGAAASGGSGDGTKTFFSFSTANLKDLSLTSNPDHGSGITTEFADNVKGIYLRGQLVSAMDDTEVTANWYNLDQSSSEPAASKAIQGGSPQNLTFSFVRSADRVMSGPYRVDIVIAGKVKQSLSFTIREATIAELRTGAAAGEASDAFRIFGVHLEDGPAVVPTREAMDSLKQAAQAGHPNAQFNLGVVFDHGDGVPEDDTAARKWYRKAAAQGNPSAQFNLALAYSDGHGSEIEIDEALGWTRKTAKSGEPLAVFAHGLYLLYGKGIPKDQAAALKLLDQSAGKHPAAAFVLASMYEDGRGLPRDLDRARHWYSSSAGNGNSAAAKALQRLSESPGN